jgi:hypothetical protein
MSIELHIERLVLDEALLGGERASAVGIAIERELMRYLAMPGAAAALHSIGAVASLPMMPLAAPGSTGQRLGARIAASVQQGLGISTQHTLVTPNRQTGDRSHT